MLGGDELFADAHQFVCRFLTENTRELIGIAEQQAFKFVRQEIGDEVGALYVPLELLLHRHNAFHRIPRRRSRLEVAFCF
ncbi:MAG: hypothetical protein LBT97_02345 [Planctomycetota bacterium]|jgi:hypothetical protein|nr:hypothetical protein [Planctomycetota bacterium]